MPIISLSNATASEDKSSLNKSICDFMSVLFFITLIALRFLF